MVLAFQRLFGFACHLYHCRELGNGIVVGAAEPRDIEANLTLLVYDKLSRYAVYAIGRDSVVLLCLGVDGIHNEMELVEAVIMEIGLGILVGLLGGATLPGVDEEEDDI
mgnify:FL=1